MSGEERRRLGTVSLVQLQPNGLIIDAPEDWPVSSFYDPARRVEVDRLEISARGIEATLATGKRVLDIHHLDHPDKAYDEDDLVCVGFAAHYDAMRTEFGDHMVDGIAGENIIIDYADEVGPEDLGEELAIENQETGEMAILKMVSFASPCVEFSRFCLQRPRTRFRAGCWEKSCGSWATVAGASCCSSTTRSTWSRFGPATGCFCRPPAAPRAFRLLRLVPLGGARRASPESASSSSIAGRAQ